MSPAIEKLQREIKEAKEHYKTGAMKVMRSGENGPVGIDVIDKLVAAIVAQDIEIEKLKHKTKDMEVD